MRLAKVAGNGVQLEAVTVPGVADTLEDFSL